MAAASQASSSPIERITSIVRWLMMCARGESATHRPRLIIMVRTPCRASITAALAPVSPAPMTSTSVSIGSIIIPPAQVR